MRGSGRYVEGQLVRTGPDSYTVVWPKDKGDEKPKRRDQRGNSARARLAAEKEAAENPRLKWYLSKNLQQVVDGNGTVVSTEVYVLKTVVVSGHKRAYLRFRYASAIYVAYTLKGADQRINYRVSTLTELQQPSTTGRKPLRICPGGCDRKLRGGQAENKPCYRCGQKARLKPCSTPGCSNKLNSNNKYGLCRHCYHLQGAPPDSMEFNPYVGYPVRTKSRSTTAAEETRGDQDED